MLAGTILRILLIYSLVKATISEGEEKKMRTALAASIAGIHGAIMNYAMSESIRADVGDLLLVFGEYRGIRYARLAGFLTLEFYLFLSGILSIGLYSPYLIASANVIPIIRRRRRQVISSRLFFP